MRTKKVDSNLSAVAMTDTKVLAEQLVDSRRKRIDTTIRMGIKSGNRTFNNVDLDLLKTDYDNYQRQYKRNKKFGTFNLDRSGAIIVSRRKKDDDYLYIVDGNHRVEEARLQKRDFILAEIHEDSDINTEAELFANQDVGKTQLKVKEKLKARQVYDPLVQQVMKIMKKHGISLDKKEGNRTLTAVCDFVKAFDRYGAEFCEWMFSFNESIGYQDEKYVYRRNWIKGMERIYTRDASVLNQRVFKLKNVLLNVEPFELQRYVNYIPSGNTREIMPRVLLNIANGKITADKIKMCKFDVVDFTNMILE